MHPLLRYTLVATPLCALLFLGLAGYFTGWDGHVVSRRPAPGTGRAVDTVLIVTADGGDTEVDWPTEVVEPLALPVNSSGVGPVKVPTTAAATHKSRFGFHFTVNTPEGTQVATMPLLTSGSVGAFAWLLGLALTNLLRSGSPLSWTKRELALPAPMPANLQETSSAPAPAKASKSRFGPPPRKRRRGVGR